MLMEKIIATENIVIDSPSKEYLLILANGSIRNLINNLEKMYILGEPVTLSKCKQLCTNINFQTFENYIGCIRRKDISGAIDILYNIHDYGYSVIDILDYFFTFIKTTDILNEETKYKIIPLLCKYITVFHNLHEDVIELALFTNQIIDIFA
jgi:DNA polymerase III gamma/tau subunit